MNEMSPLLQTWEHQLDPRHPEAATPRAHILGYGEISTVLTLEHPSLEGYALKRMPMFRNQQEVTAYLDLHDRYITVLHERGIQVPQTHLLVVKRPRGGYAVYILQRRLPAWSVGHTLVRHLPFTQAQRLIEAILEATTRVLASNPRNATQGDTAVGLDAQISNWAVMNLPSPTQARLPEHLELTYFDTSTPLMQVNGVEQLNPDLFLRSAPSFLVPIIRLLFLEDVMTRYYDLRKVIIDILANLYKEKRGDWVPDMVEVVNAWLNAHPELAITPLNTEEIRSYYREDAFIWRFYLAARKLDRKIHELLGKDYPYILPEKIER